MAGVSPICRVQSVAQLEAGSHVVLKEQVVDEKPEQQQRMDYFENQEVLNKLEFWGYS